MSHGGDALALEILQTALGQRASISRYGTAHRTPMSFVIDRGREDVKEPFDVYWVDGGPPEIFCLPGLSPPVIAFSARYLSLTAFARRLFTSPLSLELVADISFRTFLRLVAERSLRLGNSDFATVAFMTATTDCGIHIGGEHQTEILGAEHSPINEGYMATWFFGLAHEMGHLHPLQRETQWTGHYSDSSMCDFLEKLLAERPWLPPEVATRIKAKARNGEGVFGISGIRSEILADSFATHLLLERTIAIMKEVGASFDLSNFVSEIYIASNLICLLDLSRRYAEVGSATGLSPMEMAESALFPVVMEMRVHLLRIALVRVVEHYLFGREASEEQQGRAIGFVDSIFDAWKDRVSAIDEGLDRAVEFCVRADRREEVMEILEAFRRDQTNPSTFSPTLGREFLDVATSFGVDGKILRAMSRVLEDPKAPIEFDVIGELVYLVPWVEGPNDVNCPFGLDTRHGHVVFVFGTGSQLVSSFIKDSMPSLKDGFSMKTAAVVVNRIEQLGPLVAKRMPNGKAFALAVEGTPEFAELIRELVEGVIWPAEE